MPAYNAARFLPRSLPAALLAARGARVLVVDPGSDDGTPELAERLGAQVLRLGHRAGPALARNRGVESVESEVVLFIDADCVCHPDVVERVAAAFEDPSLVSLTGSYDLDPPERNFFSQYMNLRHHFVHQRAQREGAGFWAGCGALRSATFRKLGGFDAELYPSPMIEDIELGLRLRAVGRTCLDPELQVTHLKRWTLRSVVETDIKCRAIPWGKLILKTGKLPNDLNLAWRERLAAALAPFALLSLILGPLFLLLARPTLAAGCAIFVLLAVWMHSRLLRFFASVRGTRVALGVFVFHQVHLTYSAITMAILTARHLWRARAANSARARAGQG
jgi:glycosyltransferase involved in cell wall biosynthesis